MTPKDDQVPRFSDIAVFNKVAKTLSITRASELLNLSRSTVSKRLSRLEDDAGVTLLHRTARTIRLTDAGERLYDRTVRLDELMAHASEAIKGSKATPFGRLSFTVPTSLGASLTPLIMRDFQDTWPDLKLNMNLDDQHLDLVREGFDVAIRVARKLPDSSLPAKKLANTPEIVLASPGYLKKHGRPTHVRELREHRCLTLTKRDTVWRFVAKEGPVNVTVDHATTVNNDLALILTACLDGGIIRKPRLLVESEIQMGRLEIILSRFKANQEFGIYAIYPNERLPMNVEAFIKFIEMWLPRFGQLDRWNPIGSFRSE